MGCTSSSQEPSEAAEKNLEQFVSGYFAARDEGILRKGMWPYAGAFFLQLPGGMISDINWNLYIFALS